MTKHELVKDTGKNYAQIWLEMAMHYFNVDEPEIGFETADRFIEELSKRQFPVRDEQ